MTKWIGYGFIFVCGASLAAMVASTALLIWDGDGRWGWTALLLLGNAVACAVLGVGFLGMAEQPQKRSVFKEDR